MLLVFYPMYSRSNDHSPEAEAMTRTLWSDVEPKAEGNFEVDGRLYHFRARHIAPIGPDILLNQKWSRLAPWMYAAMIVAAWILVAVQYHSLGIGFKLILTVVVPIGAIFGFAVGTFQDGWLEWLGVQRTGSGLLWTNFYALFGVLFGLAVDYDIFLFARVYERRMEGYDNISAVRMGMVETGSFITVAGTIMALSFILIAMSPLYFMSQMGFVYLVGIIVDTFIIRTIIAPSALCISESFNYWPGNVPLATKTYKDD